MRRARRPSRLLVVAAAALGALGLAPVSCTVFSPKPDRSRFFVLTPIERRDASVPSRKLLLGVGPITFPRYLDRSEIVSRVGPNEVRPATFDYWAGSLPSQFERAFAQNLQLLVGADRVQAFPWYQGSPPDLTVEVDVRRLERGEDGQVRLSASWRIRNRSGEVLRTGEANLTGPGGAGDPGSGAAALSGLLGDFSREVAAGVSALASR